MFRLIVPNEMLGTVALFADRECPAESVTVSGSLSLRQIWLRVVRVSFPAAGRSVVPPCYHASQCLVRDLRVGVNRVRL